MAYRRAAYYSGATEGDLARVAFYVGNQSKVIAAIGGQRPLKATEGFTGGEPHPLGLVHVLGNEIEWTADWYAPYPTETTTDPLGPAVPPDPASAGRVRRGGSWIGSALSARSAYRNWSLPSDRYNSVGFRLVLPQPVGRGS